MTKRVYDFQVPYDAGLFGMMMVRNKIREYGLAPRLSPRLQQKFFYSNETQITKQDLDEIPDDIWAQIAATYHLAWHYATNTPLKPAKKKGR